MKNELHRAYLEFDGVFRHARCAEAPARLSLNNTLRVQLFGEHGDGIADADFAEVATGE